jgi:predicted nucleotidyltransferase
MKFGLVNEDIAFIVKTIARFDEIEKAVLFGSRAIENHKKGSDIDLAIYGDRVNMHVVSKLHALLEEESPLPYFFDVVDGTHLTHKELREHIERVGHVIYDRDRDSLM